jgi:hypothetical protein
LSISVNIISRMFYNSLWKSAYDCDRMMRLKTVSLLLCVCFLTSCGGAKTVSISPPLTPLKSPFVTQTSTATATVTPFVTVTPSFYPTPNAAELPPILQQFLGRYTSYEEMNANIQADYVFIATEVNRRPAGTLDSSPMVALSKGISDCYETAVISALLGEKLGYKPYLLMLEPPVFSKRLTHSIHVFQDPVIHTWGYNDYLLEYHDPTFSTIKELADFYILNHPVEMERYDFWYLVDLTRVSDVYGVDWRTTTKSVRIREKIIVDSGVYIP